MFLVRHTCITNYLCFMFLVRHTCIPLNNKCVNYPIFVRYLNESNDRYVLA